MAEKKRKYKKTTVNYRKGTTQQHCSICTMWIKGGRCTDVEGPIKAEDLCDIFKRKI